MRINIQIQNSVTTYLKSLRRAVRPNKPQFLIPDSKISHRQQPSFDSNNLNPNVSHRNMIILVFRSSNPWSGLASHAMTFPFAHNFHFLSSTSISRSLVLGISYILCSNIVSSHQRHIHQFLFKLSIMNWIIKINL